MKRLVISTSSHTARSVSLDGVSYTSLRGPGVLEIFRTAEYAIAVNRGWKGILLASGSVCLLAQFGLRAWVHHVVVHVTHLHIPLQDTGSFNLFAWQMVNLIAFACVIYWSRKLLTRLFLIEPFVMPAASIVLHLLAP